MEAVEVIEPNRRQQLDNFAFVIELPKFGPEVIVHFVGITRCALGQFQGSLYGKGEIVPIPEARKVLDLLFRPAMPPCQGGMRGESILASIDLRGPDDHQLF